ncbi:MAG: LPS export ABC transporter periplasmic protein LptC [Bacteroidetes bacterium]|nr:LPS export ABC transporter periplasmic protein LptC [Bacteroidota bacterium]MBP6316066.1 LPS export ABC transporter periplasmic protein LptC [Chitinophagaceae bacterium]
MAKHLGIFYCLLMLLLGSCKNDIQKLKESLDSRMLNTERAEDVTIIYSKDGLTKAKLFTKNFYHIQNVQPTYIEMSKGLRVEFYNDSLQVQSTLTAKYGKYYEQNGNVLVRDSVVVTNLKKEQLNTEELVWNEKLQKFYTEKFVKITTPTQIIYGDGLESNQNFTEYKITNIKGMIGITQNALPL